MTSLAKGSEVTREPFLYPGIYIIPALQPLLDRAGNPCLLPQPG
jgi:hypothetical protein